MQDQFLLRNFSSNSAHFTEHDNNSPASKVLDLSSTSKQAADTIPVTYEDLDSGKNSMKQFLKRINLKGQKVQLK